MAADPLVSYGTAFLAGATFLLAVATVWLAIQTQWARKDAHRPILVPYGSAKEIYNDYGLRVRGPVGPHDENYFLHVRNIGAGPAINVRVSLERGGEVLFDESRGRVGNLGAGEHDGIVTLGAEQGKPVEARDQSLVNGDRLILVCDDIFGRHFKMHYQRATGEWIWTDSKGGVVLENKLQVLRNSLGV